MRQKGFVTVLLFSTASLLSFAPGAVDPGFCAEGRAILGFVGSNFLDRSNDDWDFAPGLDFAGAVRMSPVFDLRLDTGVRWYEGAGRLVTDPNHEPRWGGRPGEFTEGLRAIPTTLDAMYRFERWSEGRFWVPYLGAGLGLYDFQATFRTADGSERKHNLFRSGWNARAGVEFQRTSGMFVNFETAAHAVDVPGSWISFYDLSVGVGARLPSR